jgi:filamentous hemagglutinin family protein
VRGYIFLNGVFIKELDMKANPCRKKRLFLIACKIVYVSTLILFSAGNVFALPNGQQVANGQASFNTQGNNLTITNSPNAIINWQGFSINNNEAVRFIQQYGSSAVLNRVIGQDPSRILGLLQSNGKVFLINPNGILFGQGARIDVNGLVASTLNLSNQDFLAGKYNFTAGTVAGAIENQGTITTPAGGKVFLIAPDIENSGIINSPQGDVTLAAGHSVYLVDSLDPDISVVVSAPANKAVNLGQIVAESGKVGIYGGLISQKGIINANSAVSEGGRIYLKATKAIELADTSVITADGTKGGKIIAMTAEDGKISGTLTGRGLLSAQGVGSIGGGGFIETSAAKVDLNGINVRTNGGNWLIDPHDFYIATDGDITGTNLALMLGGNSIVISTAAGTNSDTNLYANNETTSNGDIFVNDSITWFTSNKLTLEAHRDINISQPISAINGGLDLWAGNNLIVTGAVSVKKFTLSHGMWSQVYATLPSFTATDFKITDGTFIRAISGTGDSATPYQLADIYGVQGMGSTGMLNKSYVLANNIDATGTTNWNYHPVNGSAEGYYGFAPIGNSSIAFAGEFDGSGHTITGLYINRSGTDYVGLFGSNSGTIKNLGMVNVNTTGHHNTGGLVGFNNSGDIYNSYSTGKVTGTGTSTVDGNGDVGGLVGDNYSGTISSSYSTATVKGDLTEDVGGLVGENWGTISKSYSTGAVTGKTNVGGLAGWSSGKIYYSYSTGTVSGTYAIGGLVGYNDAVTSTDAYIYNSYSTGAVTGLGETESGGDIGGLVGYNNKGYIKWSYSTGAVAIIGDVENVGGLVGYNNTTPPHITSSFWDKDTSGTSTGIGGGRTNDGATGLITAGMMTASNFSTWDTSTIWNILDTQSYPYLKWQFTGTPQIISGKLDVTGAGKTIQTAVNGSLLATASTGANGFYYFALPSGSVSSGSSLLAYISGNAVKSASVYLSSGTHITDFSLYSDTVTASSGGTISNTAIVTAKGGLTSTDIPYTASGNNLTLSSGLFDFRVHGGPPRVRRSCSFEKAV